MASFVKPIKEQGIVLSKIYKEAKGEREFRGEKYAATPEKFLVQVMSCDEDDFDEATGIPNGTLAEYEVTKEVFDKVKFGMWAKVKYVVNQFNDKLSIKPESFQLIDKKPIQTKF